MNITHSTGRQNAFSCHVIGLDVINLKIRIPGVPNENSTLALSGKVVSGLDVLIGMLARCVLIDGQTYAISY